jgi:hypothetical protein
MSSLAQDLADYGFRRTDRESPFHDDGVLWRNSHELVCDETGVVVNGGKRHVIKQIERSIAELSRDAPEYDNSGRVIMPGGHVSSYDWGYSDSDEFIYER